MYPFSLAAPALLALLATSAPHYLMGISPNTSSAGRRISLRLRANPSIPDGTAPTSLALQPPTIAADFDAVLSSRYACTRFRPYSTLPPGIPTAGNPDPATVSAVRSALSVCLATTPTGFNVQPYRAFLISSPEARTALSRACIGRNSDRVRQSDVSVVFLADRECGRDIADYIRLMEGGGPITDPSPGAWGRKYRKLSVLVLLFSSGYSLPRVISAPISAGLRMGVATTQFVLRRIGSPSFRSRKGLVLPTLSSAETWSYKNTMLLAMSFMLGMTARSVQTCPMEGYDAGEVRKALGVKGRYGVPIIVCAGTAFHDPEEGGEEETTDDVGVKHGSKRKGGRGGTPRYRYDELVEEL